MGMRELRILYRIKLPLATATILAGIRVAVVIGVGLTTIAAYIGSGGLGEFILRGIARSDATMVLVGASLVSVLAMVVDTVLKRAEVALVFAEVQVISLEGVTKYFPGLLFPSSTS